MLRDFAMDVHGEIFVSHIGDIQVATNDDVLANEVVWRLKTYSGDWLLQPLCGASLEDFIGSPNTPDTAKLIKDNVLDALLVDGFFFGKIKDVQVTPISAHSVVVLVEISSLESTFTVPFELNLMEGINA